MLSLLFIVENPNFFWLVGISALLLSTQTVIGECHAALGNKLTAFHR